MDTDSTQVRGREGGGREGGRREGGREEGGREGGREKIIIMMFLFSSD